MGVQRSFTSVALVSDETWLHGPTAKRQGVTLQLEVDHHGSAVVILFTRSAFALLIRRTRSLDVQRYECAISAFFVPLAADPIDDVGVEHWLTCLNEGLVKP